MPAVFPAAAHQHDGANRDHVHVAIVSRITASVNASSRQSSRVSGGLSDGAVFVRRLQTYAFFGTGSITMMWSFCDSEDFTEKGIYRCLCLDCLLLSIGSSVIVAAVHHWQMPLWR
jgi:hypothetical protein